LTLHWGQTARRTASLGVRRVARLGVPSGEALLHPLLDEISDHRRVARSSTSAGPPAARATGNAHADRDTHDLPRCTANKEALCLLRRHVLLEHRRDVVDEHAAPARGYCGSQDESGTRSLAGIGLDPAGGCTEELDLEILGIVCDRVRDNAAPIWPKSMTISAGSAIPFTAPTAPAATSSPNSAQL
jgi:hypothetical protein